jgi:hypothetical protein
MTPDSPALPVLAVPGAVEEEQAPRRRTRARRAVFIGR